MIPVHRLEQSIPDFTGMAVLIIAVSAFALSFFNLQAAALQAGISPWLSWLWPVCIDALLIAGSLMILRSSLRNESAMIGWSVLISFTAVSTAFNVIHSPEGMISRAAHAIPPVALCVSIELLMMTIRSDLMTPEHVCSCTGGGGCSHATDQGDHVLSSGIQLPDHTDQAGAQAPDQITRATEHMRRSPEQGDRSEQVRLFYTEHPDSSIAQAARHLNMSRHTVKRYKPVETVQGVMTVWQ